MTTTKEPWPYETPPEEQDIEQILELLDLMSGLVDELEKIQIVTEPTHGGQS